MSAIAAATPMPDDPLCGLVKSSELIGRAPVQPASTRRMVERLREIEQKADPRSMAFLSDRSVTWLREQITDATDVKERLRLRYFLGRELLDAGRTEESLDTFQAFEDALAAAGLRLEGPGQIEMRMLRAVALLRLGEQENCQHRHNSDSCLFPLQPAAFHTLTRGSRGAIVLLKEQLRQFPDDLAARWLLNLAHMTLGEYPDTVPPEWLIPPAVFNSDYAMPRFPEVAAELGLDREELAGGCILDDFDNDGRIDVVASAWSLSGQLRFFHHEKDGRFRDHSREAGLEGIVSGLNIQQTDYNNDGWLDIWMLRGGWLGKAGRIPNSLLRNNGDGTFTDVTEEAGLLSLHPTQTSVWFDFNGDGWLDLFIGNETTDEQDPDPCELFRNNGNGTFTECAAAVGVAAKAFVKGVACGDYDNDGRPDLYLSVREGPNLLFHNDGPGSSGSASPVAWQFSEVSRKAGVSEPIFSFPTWFFDYDNDGWEDLFVSGYDIRNVGDIAADYLGLANQGARSKLYRNNRDGTFSDVTAGARLNRVFLTMGSNFGDLDNDGWLDFYLGTGNPNFTTLVPNRMFRNAEGKFFQDVTTATGTGHLQKGHAVAFVDLDHDGDQDIFADMGGAYPGDRARETVYLNPGAGGTNRWLKLKLEGRESNRVAIGARIKVAVETGGRTRFIHKTVNSGGSFGSSPLRQEIGLGTAGRIESVEIWWPATGKRQRFTGMEPNRAYRIREGDASASLMPLPRVSFPLTHGTGETHTRDVPSHARR